MSCLIIVIGMPETGLSIIQNSMYSKKTIAEFEYLDLGMPDHGGVIKSIFSNDNTWHGHKIARRSNKEINIFNNFFLEKLEKIFISGKNYIISGEDIYYMDISSLMRLKGFCDLYFNKIKVVGYVRSPKSYVESIFQTFVRVHHVHELNHPSLWPAYQEHIGKFDQLFGVNNVLLAHFDSLEYFNDQAYSGVLGFINEQLENIDHTLSSSKLSSEAISIIFCYLRYVNKLHKYTGYENIRSVMSLLNNFGSSEFKLSNKFMSSLMSSNQQDLTWINKRIGKDIKDIEEDVKVDHGITYEQDLINIAISTIYQLQQHIGDICHSKKNIELDAMLGLLSKARFNIPDQQCSQANITAVLESNFFTQDQLSILKNDKIGPAAFLREISISFERLGYIKEALKSINAAIQLRPDAVDLSRIKERLELTVC